MLPHFPPSSSPLSFSHKLKSSICCFHSSDQDDFLQSPSKTPTRSSPSSWFKSTAAEFSDLLDRCRYFVPRIARARRRYLASLDFTYDSSSYALNFEDDCHHADEFPFRDFTARFPPAIKERVPAAKFSGNQDGISISACG